jgi:dynein intermediate chain
MSGKKDEIRSQRSAALADKKRRLDELKKRRSTRQQAESSASSVTSVSSTGTNASSTIASVTSAVAASKNGNLDEYIDGLLNSTVPIGAPVVTPFMVQPAVSASASTSTGTTSISTGVEVGTSSHTDTVTVKSVSSGAGNTSTATTSAPTSTATTATDSMTMNMNKPQVETFEICTQTNEDDFPILTSETNEEDDDKENEKDDQENIAQDEKDESSSSNENNDSNRKDNNNEIIPKLLNEEEVNETINTPKFTNFLNSASKKVERLLGSSILSDLLVDDVLYYTDLQSKHNDAASKSGSGGNSGKNAIVSAQVSFEYPKWTQGRDITSIDWSVHHRGEVMLASYHMSSSSGSNGSSGTGTGTAISSIIPNATPSSSLLPKSRSEITQADGLNIIWNLTMPNRPEHILTCGSPVLESKFHPTEGNLVVGACYSGQVVVWDVRSGRLPVQRSSLNLLGGSGSSSTGGHVHPVVGMEVLDGGVRHFLF